MGEFDLPVGQPVTSTPNLGDWFTENPYLAGAVGLAGVAGGLLLMRKPALGAATEFANMLTGAVKKLPSKLPKELPILKTVPDSPVISLTEKHGVEHANALREALKGPLEVLTRTRPAPAEWIAAEAKAVKRFEDLTKAGVGETEAYEQAVAELPASLREPMAFLRGKLGPVEEAAALYLGERTLPRVPYPYLPRIVEKNFDTAVRIGNYASPLKSEIRSTLGSFEEKRQFKTMAEGIAQGEAYIDPALAMLHRTHAGIKLAATADYIKGLERGGVLFNDLEAAKAAATVFPKGGGATLVDGIPGSKTWYARSKLEAQFIRDQLVNPKTTGGLTDLVYQSNRWLRNPNLFNPLPHFTKNMMFKYGWSGGNVTKVFGDMREIATNANPQLISRFKAVMPFHKDGDTATELILDAAARVKGSNMAEFRRIIETPNKWSSRIIFEKMDPWLRYSRWKQYVAKGMNDQEAANHTWIDLIRYGTRSDLVDFWKSIPTNFFVPWRVGTVTSLLKNVQRRPAESALFLGMVDLMREVIYRKTGWWFHTPSDYVTTPIVKTIEGWADDKHQRGAQAMASIAATTAMFGPGGENADRLIQTLLKSMDKGSVEYKQVVSAFWGAAAILDPYGSFANEVVGFLQNGDPKHLVKLLQSFAFGAHSALNYRPRRLLQIIPESVISKSSTVQSAEAMQEANQRRVDMRKPYRSISERLGEH